MLWVYVAADVWKECDALTRMCQFFLAKRQTHGPPQLTEAIVTDQKLGGQYAVFVVCQGSIQRQRLIEYTLARQYARKTTL